MCHIRRDNMAKTKEKIILSGIITAALIATASLIICHSFQNQSIPSEITPRIISASDEKKDTTPTIDNALPTEETVRQKYVRIIRNTYLRKQKSYNAERIVLLKKNAECVLLEESDTFFKITDANGQTGWILQSHGELFDKEDIITHIPHKPSIVPYSMEGTKEGDEIGVILKRNGTVGAGVAIIKDGQVTYHYEYGYANREDKNNPVPVNENTKFRIASVSKVVTSMLAMAEVDDGQLDLDAELSQLFGFGFCNPKYPNTPVTMRMLLTHTSGLSRKGVSYSISLNHVVKTKDYYTSKPGTSFNYSNLGMGIAGAAVEKAANKFLSQYARDRFFTPMGIDASYDGSLLNDKSLVADCYDNGRHERSNDILTRPVGRSASEPGKNYSLGQGNLLISAVDLAKVSTILLNDGMYENKRYLSHDAVSEMLTVHPVTTRTRYEQCIGIRKFAGLVGEREMYYHTGTFYGILALMAIDPSDKSGVIVITSGAHPPRDDNTVFRVCNEVLSYCYSDIL